MSVNEEHSGIYLRIKDENINEVLKLIHKLGKDHFSNKVIEPHKILTIKTMTRTHEFIMGVVKSRRIDEGEKFIYFKCKSNTSIVVEISKLKEQMKIDAEHIVEDCLKLSDKNAIIEEFQWA